MSRGNSNAQLKAVETRTKQECIEKFGAELARIVMHPQTSKAIKSALQSAIVNIVSNESSYEWCNDEEGLAFLLPRYLMHMNDEYATGVIHILDHVMCDGLPSSVRREIKEGSKQ